MQSHHGTAQPLDRLGSADLPRIPPCPTQHAPASSPQRRSLKHTWNSTAIHIAVSIATLAIGVIEFLYLSRWLSVIGLLGLVRLTIKIVERRQITPSHLMSFAHHAVTYVVPVAALLIAMAQLYVDANGDNNADNPVLMNRVYVVWADSVRDHPTKLPCLLVREHKPKINPDDVAHLESKFDLCDNFDQFDIDPDEGSISIDVPVGVCLTVGFSDPITAESWALTPESLVCPLPDTVSSHISVIANLHPKPKDPSVVSSHPASWAASQSADGEAARGELGDDWALQIDELPDTGTGLGITAQRRYLLLLIASIAASCSLLGMHLRKSDRKAGCRR